MELYFIKSRGVFINGDNILAAYFYIDGDFTPRMEIYQVGDLDVPSVKLRDRDAELLNEALLKKSYAI